MNKLKSILFCLILIFTFSSQEKLLAKDSIDLFEAGEAAISLEPGKEFFQSSFQISGFMSVYFMGAMSEDDFVYKEIFPKNPGFSQSKFHLYLDSNFAKDWRVFGELRFLYAPQDVGTKFNDPVLTGGQNVDMGVVSSFFTGNDGHTDDWNSLKIERAFIEYTASEIFNLRTGKYLTPFGIWNQDHGDPNFTTLRMPYLILLKAFPTAQTGVNIFGRYFLTDSTHIKYDFYIGNGEGPSSNTGNDDQSFALGGRLALELLDGALKLGASFYFGDKTDDMMVGTLEEKDGTYYMAWSDEITFRRIIKKVYGLDFRLELGELVLQAEGLLHQAEGKTNAADFKEWMFYTQLEYTFLRKLTPYFRFEYSNMLFVNQIIPALVFLLESEGVPLYKKNDVVHLFSFGLNYRPIPSVVLKLDYSISKTQTSGPNYDFQMYSLGISVAY